VVSLLPAQVIALLVSINLLQLFLGMLMPASVKPSYVLFAMHESTLQRRLGELMHNDMHMSITCLRYVLT
jgi:hypothetical protein